MLKSYRHLNSGTCSRSVTITYVGRKLEEIHDILKDVKCGNKATSCPDQLALAIEDILK